MEIFTCLGIMFVSLFLFTVFLLALSLLDDSDETYPYIAYAVIAIIFSFLISMFTIKPEKFGYTKIAKDITVEEESNETESIR